MGTSVEKEKILFVATVDKKHIIKFHTPFLRWFQEQGYEVHVACAGNAVIPYCDVKHSIPFERSPLRINNVRAYKLLKRVIDAYGFKLIHCHTPMGGVIGRLAARGARKRGTRVLYTAHGFHFYKGAPIWYWLLFYPVEKWMARYTDHLITINDEDYQTAINKKFKAGVISFIKGVGIDINRFQQTTPERRKVLRQSYGYSENAFILIDVAEIRAVKHQDILIRTMQMLVNDIPSIKLLLVGDGDKTNHNIELAQELGLEGVVDFLGYRNDIPELMGLSNVAVSASEREGLPVSIMEAMAVGLPIVASNCRGNRDLVRNECNGMLVKLDETEYVRSIKSLYSEPTKANLYSQCSRKLIEEFAIGKIGEVMADLYMKELNYF